MKEKHKKALISFIYRSVICLCIFCLAFAAKRFFPGAWNPVYDMLTTNIKIDKAALYLKKLFTEIIPF